MYNKTDLKAILVILKERLETEIKLNNHDEIIYLKELIKRTEKLIELSR